MTGELERAAAPAGATDLGWRAVFEVIGNWRPVPPSERDAYMLLLSGHDVDDILAALKALAEKGFKWQPKAPDILRELNADPGKPTFEEAYRLIFGRGGVLKAQPRGSVFRGAGERARKTEAAALARAAELHPYVGAFVATVGLDWLRMLPVEDPDYGWKRREELEAAWDRFTIAADERMAAGRALSAMGRSQEVGPRRLDPLGVLGLTPPAELEAGES
jgi:hypothetical protein